MHLIIAEKHDAAKRIAQILPGSKPRSQRVAGVEAFQFDDKVVMGLTGHIVGVDYPPGYNNWQKVDCKELIRAEIVVRPIQEKIIKALQTLGREADQITIATDYDREGELIGVEALKIAQEVNPGLRADRVRYSAIVKDEILKAFQDSGKVDYELAASGEARQIIDLVWGAALTRYICLSSGRLGKEFLSVGRVQSPTLALIEVAAADVNVLILGESGTGKELLARALHQASRRAARPFVALNCAALPENLAESLLFGHSRGAFSGATQEHIGQIQAADGGTLLLDEVGELPLSLQAKLLRFLESGEYHPVGHTNARRANVRVLAATHRDLESAIPEKEFREDLFYRLSVVTIRLPPLRERAEDIPKLVRFFIQRYARKLAVPNPAIQPEALTWLQTQSWPGNQHGLELVVGVVRRQPALACAELGCERRVALAACLRLDALALGDGEAQPDHGAGHTQSPAQLLAALRPLRRPRLQAVIDVDGPQADGRVPGGDLPRRVEERHGVDPAREGDTEAQVRPAGRQRGEPVGEDVGRERARGRHRL